MQKRSKRLRLALAVLLSVSMVLVALDPAQLEQERPPGPLHCGNDLGDDTRGARWRAASSSRSRGR